MGEWKEYKIIDIAKKITSGGTPSTKVPTYYNGEIPWLKTKEIAFNRINKTESTITEEGFDNSSAKWIEKHSVIIAMYGATAAKVGINTVPLTTNQACCNITVDYSLTDPFFLFYQIWNNYEELENLAVGAAQQNLSVNVISSFLISLPPLPEQKAIAEVLSSLDDKIDMLYRQNETLEQLAETLFREWFVENEEEDWEEGILSEFIDVKYGKAHSKLKDGKYPVYGSGGLMRKVEKPLYSGESILIPRKGTLNNIMYVNEEFWTIDTMFYSIIKKKNSGKFVFHFLKQKDLASMNVGSAVPSMTTEILNNMPILIPPDTLLAEFDDIVETLYSKKEKNNNQIRILTQMRDTLLPKLMSGEVRVAF